MRLRQSDEPGPPHLAIPLPLLRVIKELTNWAPAAKLMEARGTVIYLQLTPVLIINFLRHPLSLLLDNIFFHRLTSVCLYGKLSGLTGVIWFKANIDSNLNSL